MDHETFKEKFISQVREHLKSQNLPKKAVLLISNVPSHAILKLEEGSFSGLFFVFQHHSFYSPHGQGHSSFNEEKIQNEFITKKDQRG